VRVVALCLVVAFCVLAAAGPALAAGGLWLGGTAVPGQQPGGEQGGEDGGKQPESVFDTWWAKLFCLWLLIPISAFVRRLFTGWLNFLGVDEEKWAGLAAAGVGGLVALGTAFAGLTSAGARTAGWLAGGLRYPRIGSKPVPPGGGGGDSGGGGAALAGSLAGGEAVAGTVGPADGGAAAGTAVQAGGVAGTVGSADGGTAAGAAVQAGGIAGTAGHADGGEAAGMTASGYTVVSREGGSGDGLPEAGSVIERRQAASRMREAMAEYERQSRRWGEAVRDRSEYWAGLAGRGAELAGAVFSATGALVGLGMGGGKAAVYASEAMGRVAAAPFRAVEAYFQTPPPRWPHGIDGPRFRVV